MKKCLSIFIASLLTAFCYAYDVEVDGIYYNLNKTDHTATVTYAGINGEYKESYSGDVVIPENINVDGNTFTVTEIGEYAFIKNYSVNSVTMPNSIKKIGRYAFKKNSIQTFVFSENIEEMGEYVFEDNKWYKNQPEGWLYVGKCLVGYIGSTLENTDVEVKDGTVGVANGLYKISKQITSVKIPNSVKYIADHTFSGCINLTSITLSDQMVNISANLFSGCTSLTSVTIPNSVEIIDRQAFAGCSSLKSVKFSKNLSDIGYSAFNRCTSLTSVSLPNGLSTIGSNAFDGCTNLSSIYIPNSVHDIDIDAFKDTKWYESQPDGIVYAGKVAYSCKGSISGKLVLANGTIGIAGKAFYQQSKLTITLPNTIKTIGETPFWNCNSDNFTIPESVETIHRAAFVYFIHDGYYIPKNVKNIVAPLGGYYISKIEVDSNNPYLDSRDNCNAIIETATNTLIHGCSSTVIPNGVEKIGDRAFCATTHTELTIPGSVKEIGEEAFYECINLKNIIFEEGLEVIRNGAFSGCNSLTSIALPNSLIYIFGRDVFPDNSIETVSLGSNVRGIETSRFLSNAKNVTCIATTPPDVYISGYVTCNGTLHVLPGCKDKYKAHSFWGRFPQIVEDAVAPSGINDVKKSDNPSNSIYTIMGLRVNSLQKGINIVDGKKFIVK